MYFEPEIFLKRKIKNIYSRPRRQWEDIGKIILVNYFISENPIFFIEYEIDQQWRNQGIMSKELPKYLKYCKKHGFNRLVALVKENNLASIKLLEKNGFLKSKKIDNIISYVTHLDITCLKMLQFSINESKRINRRIATI